MKKIISLCLSIVFIMSTASYSFADTNITDPPVEPTKPKVENYQDNDKIKEYNQKAEEYNQKVDEYNAAESTRVENSNKEKTEQYNKDKAKYEEDLAQYEQDRAAYESKENQTDIKNEQIILNQARYYNDKGEPTHFNSIGEYNMLPLKSGPTWDEETQTYIPPTVTLADLAKKAVYRNGVRQENNALKEQQYNSTIVVQEAETKSGEKFTLYLTHYLLTNGQIYTEKIEFDANDIVTVNSLSKSNIAKLLYEDSTYAAFYTYQGDSLLSYYWYESFGDFQYTPAKVKEDIQVIWDNGNKYIITYKNGKKYYSDSNEIYLTYYYNSKITANIPLLEPIAPIAPILQLETFKPISHISLLNLFAVPTQKQHIKRNIINNRLYGLGDGVKPIKKSTIANTKTPLISNSQKGSWALINLIVTILAFFIAFILIVMAFINKRKESDELQIKNKLFGRETNIILSILTSIIFLLTEDMSLPMALIDKWTPLMVVLLLIQITIMILCKHKEVERAS